MVSPTQQTESIRRRKRTTNGRSNKLKHARYPTPPFPVHPEGYDANAADAKPQQPVDPNKP
jgi:hypothetical protein